jgi:hypothetical protein
MKTLLVAGILLLTPGAEWWKEEQDLQASGNLVQTTQTDQSASRLDWERGVLEVVAHAACDPATALSEADCYRRALSAARVLAYQKLAETLHGVAIDGHATLSDELLEDSHLRAATRGLVAGARVVGQGKETAGDGSLLAHVSLRLEMYPADGDTVSVAGALLPALRAGMREEPPAFHSATASPLPSPITGLILDARAAEARPALSPSITEEGGSLLYGRSLADSVCACATGLVSYTSSVERARRLEHRVGEAPLVVQVMRTDGPTRADLVVSSEDAARVAAADRREGFLRRCAVVVVLE